MPTVLSSELLYAAVCYGCNQTFEFSNNPIKKWENGKIHFETLTRGQAPIHALLVKKENGIYCLSLGAKCRGRKMLAFDHVCFESSLEKCKAAMHQLIAHYSLHAPSANYTFYAVVEQGGKTFNLSQHLQGELEVALRNLG